MFNKIPAAFSFALLARIACMAQVPCISSTYNNPLMAIYYGTAMDYQTPGPSGEGVEWMFDTATRAGQGSFGYFDSSSIAFDGDSFPRADYEIGENITLNTLPWGFDFFQATADSFVLVGIIYNNTHHHNTFLVYHNGEILLKYPMIYGTDYIDTFYATSHDPDDGSILYRSGTVHVTCDGYGTLYLPVTNTFSHVFRVKMQENYVDSNPAQGVNYVSGLYYRWYLSGTRYPVMMDEEIIVNGDTSFDAQCLDSNCVQYIPQYLTGIEPVNAGGIVITSCGNTVVASHLPGVATNFALFNMCGQEVFSASLNGENQSSFCLQGLSLGIYLARITGTEITETRKLIIAK